MVEGGGTMEIRAVGRMCTGYKYWIQDVVRNEGVKRGRITGGQIVGIKEHGGEGM